MVEDNGIDSWYWAVVTTKTSLAEISLIWADIDCCCMGEWCDNKR
jgi:hypothetical protein